MDSASKLISVDVNATYQDVAHQALGHDPRLTLITEDALAFLKRQPEASFDFVFADALAGKYEGLNEALRVVKAGGFYVIDDMLPQSNWPDGHAAKVPLLLEALAALTNFEMTPMAWASGLVIMVRKLR
jgi:predicted O-methyltransferase YrrM